MLGRLIGPSRGFHEEATAMNGRASAPAAVALATRVTYKLNLFLIVKIDERPDEALM